MNTLTVVFISLLGLTLVTQIWLAQRHVRYLRARRNRVPAAFKGKIPLKAHRKAADYSAARARFEQWEDVYGAVLLLIWTVGGGLELLDRMWRSFEFNDLLVGLCFVLSVFLAMGALAIPGQVYQTFVLEQRFGFNRATPILFIGDLIKRFVLALAIGIPFIFLVLWLISHLGRAWWVGVWGAWIGFTALMVWAYPAVIAPLFNRFRPLKRGGIRQRVQKLLRRTGFKSDGIFVIDSSRRTAHGNAYFTGFGKNKRIVFFDSLLKSLREPEIEAVVAHELGHFKLKHVTKRLGVMALLSFIGLALLGWLAEQMWFYTGLGVRTPSPHAALMLFLLVVPIFTYFFNPFFAWSSRRHEFEADDFAAEQSNARQLISALIKLYKENASTLTPDPLHSAFYDSHPPALARIAHLKAKT
jgi:STE24 endopeptidase